MWIERRRGGHGGHKIEYQREVAEVIEIDNVIAVEVAAIENRDEA